MTCFFYRFKIFKYNVGICLLTNILKYYIVVFFIKYREVLKSLVPCHKIYSDNSSYITI